MRFVFAESAVKDIKKLSKSEQARLKKKLLYWQNSQDPLTYSKTLTQHQEATHRFRFGPYRVIVKVIEPELRILRVRHRKDVYKK